MGGLLSAIKGPMARRVAGVIAAYVVTFLFGVGVILVLRRTASAAEVGHVLSYYAVTQLASGVEPGATKARLLTGQEARGRLALTAAAPKALIGALLLSLIWRFADSSVPWTALLCTPLIAFAGLATTELRVGLDARGEHALAQALKQSSQIIGLLVVGAAVLAKLPFVLGVGAAALVRIAIALALVWREAPASGSAVMENLRHPMWWMLAGGSLVGSVGGNIDRWVAQHDLAPQVFATYFLLYEPLVRFWVIPYLLDPIIFARRAARLPTGDLLLAAWALVATGFAGLLGVVWFAMTFLPRLTESYLGGPVGFLIYPLAVGIGLNGFSQIAMSQLQSAGRVRAGLTATSITLVVSAALFGLLIPRFGLAGLAYGWLARSIIELAVIFVLGREVFQRRT
jgi:O-antigen/teichoic acid export membrane protein